jgi:hypothetical protein
MNYMPEMLNERKVKLAITTILNAITDVGDDEAAGIAIVLAAMRKDRDVADGLAMIAYRQLAEVSGDRDGVEAGRSRFANRAEVPVPASAPTNSGAEGQSTAVSGRGHTGRAPAPLPERGEEGRIPTAPRGAFHQAPSSPLPLSKNTGGAGQSPVARERQWPAARPPVAIRKPSPVELMAARKVEDVAANSIFKTFMVRGRSIGSYRFGELEDTERLSLVEASVCRRIREHAPMTHGNLLISSVFTEAQIKKFIEDATREVSDAA